MRDHAPRCARGTRSAPSHTAAHTTGHDPSTIATHITYTQTAQTGTSMANGTRAWRVYAHSEWIR